jgi:hypothetical protein
MFTDLPSTLSTLTRLSLLDVSTNLLQHDFPSFVTALTALCDLRVNNNQLSGQGPCAYLPCTSHAREQTCAYRVLGILQE